MEILTEDELSLFVWSDYKCYTEGRDYAKRKVSNLSWCFFVSFAISRYNKELHDYKGDLPLEQWGTMAARFKEEFESNLEEYEPEESN